MALQFTSVEEPSFSRGIDARSAENQIRDGYVRDLVNCDIVEGRAKKRKGYATYAGNIPARVTSIRQVATTSPPQICFGLDGSIDLSRLSSTPILVYGKSGLFTSGQGPFTTAGNSVKYYTSWENNLKKLILAGSAGPPFVPAVGTISAPFTEHGIPSQDIFVGFSQIGAPGLSNSQIYPELDIDGITYDIDIDYTNSTTSQYEALVYYRDGRAILGQNYTNTYVLASPGNINIPASGLSGHNLLTNNIIYRIYRQNTDTPTKWDLIKPDVGNLNFTTGDVTLTLSQSGTYRVLLASLPQSKTYTGGAALSGTQYIFPVPNITSPYFLYTLYNNVGDEIIPDEAVYDDSNNLVTFYFATNPGALTVYYDYGSIRANEIVVNDVTVTTSGTDEEPQLTIYGFDHNTLYGQEKEVNRKGWATHLDSYRSPRTTHMVTGLGGNLFAALSPSSTFFPPELVAYTPTWHPRLNVKVVSGGVVIGPAFHDKSSIPSLTRGYIAFDSGGTNWATVTQAEYQGGPSKLTRYTLSTPGLVYSGTPISTTFGLEDYLTLQGMSHSRHRGTFKIKAVSYGIDTITIDVINPNVTTSDYDDVGCAGLAGIFTDRIVTATVSPFLEKDIILSSTYGDETELVALSTTTTSPYTTLVSQVYNVITLSSGLTLTGKRTSTEMPLRALNGTPTSANIVVGDTVYFSEVDYPLQVVAIDYNNHVVTLDKAVTWQDNISLPSSLSVKERWIPAEVPTPDSTDVTLPKTTIQHLSVNQYSNQPFLRSAMVQNNLYLTNGDDEVYKYDGQHFYRAGIIPWQPGLFLSTESVSTGGIAILGSGARGITALIGAQLRLTDENAAYFLANDVVRFQNAEGVTQLLTIDSIEVDSSLTGHKLVSFKDTLEFTSLGTLPTLTLVYQARYYFRFNVKDVNGVVVASAVTGAADFVATISPEIGKQFKVLLKLVGLPPWDRYDYRNKNIELEIYRTLWSRGSLGEVPTFYRLRTFGLTYENNSGYIEFVDNYGNQTLSDAQSDFVVGTLSPTPLPADWDEPPRSKYVTTAGNRLVLANVTDWPKLAMTYLEAGTAPFSSFNGQSLLFKKDKNDSGTTTDMLNRVRYEARNGGSSLACIPCSCTTTGEFKVVIPSITSTTGYAAGQWLYLYHSAVSSGRVGDAVIPAIGTTMDVEDTIIFPSVGDLVYFEVGTGGTLPNISPSGTLSTSRGYFVTSVSTSVTGITAVNQNTGANTIQLVSVAGFPASGKVTVNGVTYTYSSISGTTLQGVSPLITFSKDTVVYLVPNITISETYNGPAISFTSTGSNLRILWDGSELDYAGWYQVNSVDLVPTVNYLRLTLKDSTSSQIGIPKQFPNRVLFATNKYDVPVLAGIDGNLGMYNGNGPLAWQSILRRYGMAINATMRMVDTTLSAYKDFVPWLVARSELDTGGQLIVSQPRAERTTVSMTLGGSISISTYVNGELLPSGNAADFKVTRYPSRVLASYDNYPEIFDNPWTIDTPSSDSAIDVNSADGQEITGVIPFFGESAFGSSLQGGVLVVFKQNSIYLVNLEAKANGQDPVQRLETQGLGCTAPYSIAPTKDGIAFANDSGIYVLRPNQRIEYLGRFVERLWQKNVDKDYLDLVQGHHYGIGRQYKLSVPIRDENLAAGYMQNSQVYVYNHTGEATDEPGGWARYTNHFATGWANLFQDAFFSTSNGSVKRLSTLDEGVAYLDDANAIESILEARATAFNNTAIRKVVATVTVHYRSGANSDNTAVYMATDLKQEYDLSSSFRVLTKPGVVDGLGSVTGQDIVSIAHSFPKRRCIYVSIKIVNNGKEENVEIAGFSYTVAGLSAAGIKQAAETE